MGELAGTAVLTLLLLSTTTRRWDTVRWPFKAALGLLYGAVVLAGLVLAPFKADRATLVALSVLLLLIAATTPWWAKLPHGIKVALRVPYLLLFVTQVVRTARGF